MDTAEASQTTTNTTNELVTIDILSKSYQYKGVTLPAIRVPDILESLKDWQTRPDDVLVVTYPKSGTHWIWEIVSLIMQDVDVEKIDRTHLLHGLDVIMSHTVDGLATVEPGYQAMSKWESPRVMGSHILEEFVPEHIKKKRKVIYFSRNAKDVSISYFKFFAYPALPLEMKDLSGFLPFFLSEKMLGGSWFRHVKGWFALKDQPNVLCCKYEDFHKDLRGSIKRVANFLERPLSDEKLNKIVELTEMKGMQKTYQEIEERMGDTGKSITRLFGQVPFLRKGKVGGWKDEFTVAENEYFDKVYQQNMEGSGIEFQFEL